MVSFVVSSVWCMRLGVSVVLVRRMNGALMMIMMMMAGICTDTTNVSHSLNYSIHIMILTISFHATNSPCQACARTR